MEERLHELTKVMAHLQPHEVFEIAGIPVTTTVFTTWIMMAILILIAFVTTRKLSLVPRGWQHLPELAVEFIFGVIDPVLGKNGRKYLPLIGTLFMLILFLNLAWFIPIFKPPTMDLSTTAAFAITIIILVQLIGIKEKGIKHYLKHWISPSIAMMPLNVIEELVKPVSLSLRLFGNMFGEEMVVAILFILMPLFVPIPLQVLGVLMGFIQAFVFTLLSVAYIHSITAGH